MRRFLLPVLILTLALLLSACAGANNKAPGDPAEWGKLRATLENVQQTEKQWSANIVVHNPTEQLQSIQYRGASRYTMVVTREGETILRQDFDPMDPEKPQILNLTKGVSKKHIVVWTYLDQEGNKVPPGTYEITAVLNAVTTPKTGQGVVQPPTFGPVKVIKQ